ncbi:MAG: hypothetical protein JO161_07410, partial [Planctomycetaceae bacterium]|nr:hypothetical protein [Planctomycetaceae bacterium]
MSTHRQEQVPPLRLAALASGRDDEYSAQPGAIAMKVWHFSELAYYPAWEKLGNQLRNVVPSRLCEPEVAAELYHRGLDEWVLCDELGLNIMVNEHHATATCIDSVCTIPMAILARETKKARL